MNIKRFRTVCRISSYGLKTVSILYLFILVFGLFTIFFGNGNFWFTYDGPSFSIFNSQSSMSGLGISDSDIRLASLIVAPLGVIVASFVFWKGGELFKNLGDGETPFSSKFTHTLKLISLLLIITDIIFPILYSIILSTIYEDGHYVILGVGSAFLIGIILYAISEVFNYGIELQYLADETV